ncbi:MAG: GTP-binding protein [Candidatus Saccharibacteria bacterium]|nr:GTP-binding protein [Candidatus Saccharibacteria bacterium]
MKQKSVPDQTIAACQIPVAIISGHLGSGKTSLINKLLTNAVGLKIGVIVNDFGKLNIDAMLVEQSTSELIALSNGCICCSLANELDDSLNELARSDSQLDLILIEASGVSNPLQMVELIYNSQNQFIRLLDLIYVVDGANFQQLVQVRPELIHSHLTAAKLIILNKIDLLSPEEIATIETQIREVNPYSTIIKTSYAEFNPQLLLDLPDASQPKLGQNPREHFADYISVTFRERQALDPITTTKFLNNLPSGVYRLKGWMYFGKKSLDNQKILIQKVGQTHSLSGADWQKHEDILTELVFIGTDFDGNELLRKLQTCIDQHPNDIRDDNVIDSSRF